MKACLEGTAYWSIPDLTWLCWRQSHQQIQRSAPLHLHDPVHCAVFKGSVSSSGVYKDDKYDAELQLKPSYSTSRLDAESAGRPHRNVSSLGQPQR